MKSSRAASCALLLLPCVFCAFRVTALVAPRALGRRGPADTPAALRPRAARVRMRRGESPKVRCRRTVVAALTFALVQKWPAKNSLLGATR